jgi:hypothetical protein
MTLSEILFDAMNNADTRDKDMMYNIYKRDIQRLNLPPQQYQDAINKLCELLEY